MLLIVIGTAAGVVSTVFGYVAPRRRGDAVPRPPADGGCDVYIVYAVGIGPSRQPDRAHGGPAHPKPFGMRAVPGREYNTHSWTLVRNGERGRGGGS
jgi:hypothetical protein